MTIKINDIGRRQLSIPIGFSDRRSKATRRTDGHIWQRLIQDKRLIEQAEEGVFKAGVRNTPEDSITRHLWTYNERLVREAVSEDLSDEMELLKIVSTWPEGEENLTAFTFLGLRITTKCNLKKRCVYCDQREFSDDVDLEKWKDIIKIATQEGNNQGLYIGISGGEPLLKRYSLYDLIRYAADYKGVVNLNTNAQLISPVVALRLIASGLAKAHISFDTSSPELFGGIYNDKGAFEKVMRGVYNLRLAKDLAGVDYPVMHINMVATKHNIEGFNDLFGFLLDMRRLASHYDTGNTHTNPNLRDLVPHLIPLGGERNKELRPTEEQWKKFFEESIPKAEDQWREFQNHWGVLPEEQSSFRELAFFSNPFTRVKHDTDLNGFINAMMTADYAKYALTQRCYAAPTQAYILPDGNVYHCSSRADHRAEPTGNILYEEISTILERQKNFIPDEECYGCLGSPLAINQKVEKLLLQKVKNSFSNSSGR